jgi:flagellar basal-body rod protein FlgC
MSDLLFSVMRTIGSGLTAQRKRMESTAENLANAETTKTESGFPYRKKTVRVTEKKAERTTTVASPRPNLKLETTSPLHIRAGRLASWRRVVTQEPVMEAEVTESGLDRIKYVYDPHHPDANSEGYVAYPDINPVEEMVDMMEAARAYEANIAAMDAFKSMVEKALEI